MLEKGLFHYMQVEFAFFNTCSDIFLLCQPFYPLDTSKFLPHPCQNDQHRELVELGFIRFICNSN